MTESEMLAEMMRLIERPQSDPGFTAREMAKEAGVPVATMHSRLDVMVRRGLMVRGWRYPLRGKRMSVYRPA